MSSKIERGDFLDTPLVDEVGQSLEIDKRSSATN
jgi:hypothetical protein